MNKWLDPAYMPRWWFHTSAILAGAIIPATLAFILFYWHV